MNERVIYSNERVLYSIPAPDSMCARIDVYCDPDMGSCEWRFVEAGQVLRDTKSAGYEQAEIALRDALMWCTGLQSHQDDSVGTEP